MTEKRFLDTNVLLRFFMGEPHDLAKKARSVITEADAGNLILVVLPQVIGETIYTLESFYGMQKNEVCNKMAAFLRCRGIAPYDEAIMLDALERYRSHKVHFVDACLAAYSAATNQPVHSFDQDFKKFKDVTWKS